MQRQERAGEYVGGCQCGSVRYRANGPTRSLQRLLLLNVPESVRRAVHGLCSLPRPASALAEVAGHVREFKLCRERILQKLWDAARVAANQRTLYQSDNIMDDPESVRPE